MGDKGIIAIADNVIDIGTVLIPHKDEQKVAFLRQIVLHKMRSLFL